LSSVRQHSAMAIFSDCNSVYRNGISGKPTSGCKVWIQANWKDRVQVAGTIQGQGYNPRSGCGFGYYPVERSGCGIWIHVNRKVRVQGTGTTQGPGTTQDPGSRFGY